MTTSITSINSCQHEEHLFAHPLCPHQSLVRRIANIAFHIFTCFIPLIIYHIGRAIFPWKQKNDLTEEEEEPWIPSLPKQRLTEMRREQPPYSAEGMATLIFARRILRERPEIGSQLIRSRNEEFAPFILQPMNDKIAKLNYLEAEVFYPEFEQAIKDHPENPWDNPDVLQAADNYMKICFAISASTLDDLPLLVESLSQREDERTVEQLISDRTCYVKHTFFLLAKAYHNIRSGIYFNPDDERGPRIDYPETPSLEHSERFYQNGSMFRLWNKLHNEFCERMAHFVDLDEMEREFPRYLSWIKKDEAPEDFQRNPGPFI